ncbi:hypothetical protein T05_11204, partial [Trichinella murrelli]
MPLILYEQNIFCTSCGKSAKPFCIDFLFGLQNIVKLKGTLLDCWGRPHPTLEKHIVRRILYMI